MTVSFNAGAPLADVADTAWMSPTSGECGERILIGGEPPAPDSLWLLARRALDPDFRIRIEIDRQALTKMNAAAEFVAEIVRSKQPVYGINTGVGHFADVLVPPGDVDAQQRNLIRSHCCGVGELLTRDIVLAMWLIRLHALSLGHSGTRLATVETIVRLLEAGVLAEIPSRGSVGASGDLAPSAHAALPLLGEGWCTLPEGDGFRRLPASAVLAALGMEPPGLAAKEGLSLINGTQLTTALALKACFETKLLLRTANLAAAMTIEAVHGARGVLDARLLALHRHEGTSRVGEEMRGWLAGDSEIHDAHAGIKWAQDPYSLRCAPQVHGAVWDELRQASQTLEHEIGAATDNPLLFPAEKLALSCGHFHAIQVARVSDRLASALTTLAAISERRINLMMNGRRTGLPDFLVADGGMQSGYMMAQVTAAALVSECKGLSFPASVDTIPTNNDQEDHVSMGPAAGFKALSILEKVRQVLAIELMTAAQALDLRRPRRAAAPLERVHGLIRSHVPPLTEDRVLSGDMQCLAEHIAAETFLE